MEQEIIDPNCIVKAFQNKNISIIKDEDNKYYFRGSDVAKALEITNIRSSIQNFTSKEKGVRKVDTLGGKQDIIFLSSHGVYRLLYSSKKKIAENFREWVGDILDDIIFNQSKELQKQLENQKTLTDQTVNKLQLLELENQEKQNKINLLTRKTNKFELGESVYIFHSTFENKDLYKVGRTKNANVRDSIHKTASYKGILLQVKCVDCVLLERIVHFLLNKYRCANRREWFSCSYDVVKNSIYYGKAFIEDEIDFTNSNLIDDTYSFIKTISIKRLSPPQNNLKIHKETPRNIFTKLDFEAKDINNFEQFLTAACEIDANASLSYITIKNQYKIWSKTAKHIQLKKFIEYLKKNYTTSMKRYNPLVSTSKLTPHFNGLKLKKIVLEFESPKNENNVIENFLYEKCQRSPGYRITMQECFEEFEKWYIEYYNNQFTHVIKENVKKYFDIQFIRLRSNNCNSNSSSTIDNRLGGWLGFALKSNNQPEPIKHYKPKNAKIILQINSSTNETINKWDSISELSDYINRSRSVTSGLIQRHEQIYIDNILCILEYV
jgi:prophage antirepressor-like protein